MVLSIHEKLVATRKAAPFEIAGKTENSSIKVHAVRRWIAVDPAPVTPNLANFQIIGVIRPPLLRVRREDPNGGVPVLPI